MGYVWHAFLYFKDNIIVMAKDKMYMPQSTAGLIRYFDESKESIKLKPEHVLGICIAIIAIELIMKFFVF